MTSSLSTLRDEHALLLREVQTRCSSVIAETDVGRWPDRDLRRLLDYLHVEVLQQIADEEWRLFRTHGAPRDLEDLRVEHLELRQRIAELTDAATLIPRRTPRELAAQIGRLLDSVQNHFRDEQALIATGEDGSSTPATSALGSRPHEWYARTEGPVIDVSALPGAEGADAILARLLRMRRGERVELRATSDPAPLWRRLASTVPDVYGFAYLERVPDRWRVEVTRRPDAG